MKEIEDEFREIREASGTAMYTVPDIENIFEDCHRKAIAKMARPLAVVRRLYPECYRAFSFGTVPIKCLHEETLFYIFYALCGSELQVKAYNELIFRNYLYSTTMECFVIQSYVRIPDGKKKSIIIFDPIEWQKSVKEVVFDQRFVESLVSYVEEVEESDSSTK